MKKRNKPNELEEKRFCHVQMTLQNPAGEKDTATAKKDVILQDILFFVFCLFFRNGSDQKMFSTEKKFNLKEQLWSQTEFH